VINILTGYVSLKKSWLSTMPQYSMAVFFTGYYEVILKVKKSGSDSLEKKVIHPILKNNNAFT